MAIKQKESINTKPIIDLTGPDGNVFVLMSYARQYARELNMDAKPICDDMMSSDYEHAVRVFDNTFGDYVDLAR
jgi:hypothetical protein